MALKMKVLHKCCCGCTVKTGALLFSYISLIEYVVPILNILSNTAPDIAVNDKEISNEYKRGVTLFCVVITIIVVHALYGIYKKKPGYMVPYLLYKLAILFFFTMMLGFAPAIVDHIKNYVNEETSLRRFIISIVFFIGIEAYSFLILFSHYHNLRVEASERANPSAVGFTLTAVTVPQSDNLRYVDDGLSPKKQPPPPYAV